MYSCYVCNERNCVKFNRLPKDTHTHTTSLPQSIDATWQRWQAPFPRRLPSLRLSLLRKTPPNGPGVYKVCGRREESAGEGGGGEGELFSPPSYSGYSLRTPKIGQSRCWTCGAKWGTHSTRNNFFIVTRGGLKAFFFSLRPLCHVSQRNVVVLGGEEEA